MKEFIRYVSENIRGLSKLLFLSPVFNHKNQINKKITFLKKKIISRRADLLTFYALTEFLRLYKFYKRPKSLEILLRHSLKGFEAFKILLIIDNLFRGNYVFDTEESIKNLLKEKIISIEESAEILKFWHASLDRDSLKTHFFKKEKLSFYTISKIFNRFLNNLTEHKSTYNQKIYKDIKIALESKNRKQLEKIFRKYINYPDPLIKNIIFYFLGCNKKLPPIIVNYILNLPDDVTTVNLKRNLIEYNRFNKNKSLLKVLMQSKDKKLRYFAKICFKRPYSVNQKIIRF